MRRRYSYNGCSRQMETREIVKNILLLCEGEKTEPYYFKKFISRDNKKCCLIAKPTEFTDIKNIVLEAIKQKDNYSEVWCVCDKDNNPPADFNAAIEMAARKGVFCVYSNECFELWYLLHFQMLSAALPRHGAGSYKEKLSTELVQLGKDVYRKNRDDMYDILLAKQSDAIRNAKRIESYYAAAVSPSDRNPTTTVYSLVERLNSLQG